MQTISKALVASALLLAQCIAHCSPEFGSFEGESFTNGQGYQEIKLSAGRWYLAYQGNRDTASEWVDAAWAARAAQLCVAIGAQHYVELRYQFEEVTTQDKASVGLESGNPWAMVNTAGSVPVPIFIPMPQQPVMPLTAPSKLQALQCIVDVENLKDKTRALETSVALQKAKELGIVASR